MGRVESARRKLGVFIAALSGLKLLVAPLFLEKEEMVEIGSEKIQTPSAAPKKMPFPLTTVFGAPSEEQAKEQKRLLARCLGRSSSL